MSTETSDIRDALQRDTDEYLREHVDDLLDLRDGVDNERLERLIDAVIEDVTDQEASS